MLSTIGLATVLFASTNIDDVFVLIGFFADPRFQSRQVIFGQYLGIIVLVGVSIIASLVSLVLSHAYVGLLGIIPIPLGLKKMVTLYKGAKEEDDANATKYGLGNVLAVAVVTTANGGDNIGIYTPVFATSTFAEIIVIISVFALMVAVWLVFSSWLVYHPSLGSPIRSFGHVLTPFVLIAIGAIVLYEANAFSLLSEIRYPQ